MKRKSLFLSLLVICISIVAMGSLAYFNAEGTAHNVVTTGGVNIEVVEQMKDGNTLVDFPEEGIRGVMPGTSVSKIVKVKNTGTSEAWIRVKVSMFLKGADGGDLPLKLANDSDVMSFTVMDGWVDGGDGYYYYTKPIVSDAFTDVLFEEVEFNPAMGNEYQNCAANILVYAQAVQTANNQIPDGGDVTDIKGWPEEEREEG